VQLLVPLSVTSIVSFRGDLHEFVSHRPYQVLARTGWRCQACGARRRLDVHHVVKRSQGGSDLDLDRLVTLCRWCHDQTDAPYERGRLVMTALSAGQFTSEVVARVGLGTPPARVPLFAHAGKKPPSYSTTLSGTPLTSRRPFPPSLIGAPPPRSLTSGASQVTSVRLHLWK
jgi:HNH endonuclease